jgi:hypothetical protein
MAAPETMRSNTSMNLARGTPGPLSRPSRPRRPGSAARRSANSPSSRPTSAAADAAVTFWRNRSNSARTGSPLSVSDGLPSGMPNSFRASVNAFSSLESTPWSSASCG